MSPELSEALKRDFPRLYASFDDKFWVGDGWEPLLRKLSEDVESALSTDEPIHVIQVKEKFGGLRFYVDTDSDEIYSLVRKAENESFTICEDCGKSGKLGGKGWLRTTCRDHRHFI